MPSRKGLPLSGAALITGASSGIGEAFASALAARGRDLILVARSEDKLKALAKQLAEIHARRVEVIAADLTHAGVAARVFVSTQALGMPVDLLVNNAGFGSAGAFHKLDAARERDEILLNCAAVVDLCHAFLPAMLERNSGGIINVASMAAFQAMPTMTVYAATKAFVLSFTEGLRGELMGKGVQTLCVCPGPVDTPFFESTGNTRLRTAVPGGAFQTPEEVVAESLRAWDRNRAIVVPGALNKLMALGSRMTPRPLLTRAMAMAMRR